MASVVIDKLSKIFRAPNGATVQAVREVTLEIKPGELLVLVGPSGSGKTTLLRMVAGLETPSGGSILLDDRPVTALPAHERNVAMVFQEHALYPYMTVFENLAFGLKLRRHSKAEMQKRVQEAADVLGLARMLERLPRDLSGGERQRVALGRAMVLNPAVFLLDEPLSNLDAPLRAQMRREIVSLQRRLGSTMIYVTHDQTESMVLGDRMAVIKGGAIQQVGRPADVYSRPCNLFVAQFIGAPPMNLCCGKLRPQGDGLWFRPGGAPDPGRDDLAIEPPGQPALWAAAEAGTAVVLGLRAEHIQLAHGDAGAEAGDGGRRGEEADPLGLTHLAGDGLRGIEAVVQFVETLGWETHLHLTIGGCSYVARALGPPFVPVGAKVRVILDLRQAHWFNAESGARLC